jgi:hypothetical protein
VRVTELLKIEGDVDIHTGNIHTKTSVHVTRHVRSGFTVESEGDIIVDGGVGRSTLKARGNVVVKAGLRGTVSTAGSVTAAFVENGSIDAGGDIDIRNHVTRTTLVSGANIRIGKILYGCVSRAVGQVVVGQIGHRAGVVDEVYLGITFDQRSRLRELHRLAEEGLAPAERREYDHLRRAAELASVAALRVIGSVYPDVLITIGELVLRVQDETKGTDYHANWEETEIVESRGGKGTRIPATRLRELA